MTLSRSTPLRSRSSLTRRTKVKNTNRRRRAKEFARAYGSEERVEFVRNLPCIVCGSRPSENAHIVTGGMGRKADYQLIVPLSSDCHAMAHAKGMSWLEVERGIDLELAAACTEAAWQSYSSNL
jgi:hypothetical protein